MRNSCPKTFLVSVGLASLAASASGTLINYDNSALGFRLIMHVPSFFVGNYLDITQSPGQSGAANSNSVRWEEFPLQTSSSITSMDLVCNPEARLAQGSQNFQCQINSNVQNYTAVKTFGAGEVIGAGEDWQQFTSMGAHGFGPRWYFLGDGGTLGVQVQVAGETHYGYITLAKVTDTAQQNYEYQPVAWGYEDQANIPITVPSAGSTALMVAAGAIALKRRR